MAKNAETGEQANAIHQLPGHARSLQERAQDGRAQQDGHAPQCHPDLHSPRLPAPVRRLNSIG